MNTNFKVNPEEARGALPLMTSKNDEMLADFQELQRIVVGLRDNGTWEGSASEQFIQTFEEIGIKVTELHTLVTDAGVNLTNAVNLYEETNAQIAQAMQLQ